MIDPPNTTQWQQFSGVPATSLHENSMIGFKTKIGCVEIAGMPKVVASRSEMHPYTYGGTVRRGPGTYTMKTTKVRKNNQWVDVVSRDKYIPGTLYMSGSPYWDINGTLSSVQMPKNSCIIEGSGIEITKEEFKAEDCESKGFSASYCSAAPKGPKFSSDGSSMTSASPSTVVTQTVKWHSPPDSSQWRLYSEERLPTGHMIAFKTNFGCGAIEGVPVDLPDIPEVYGNRGIRLEPRQGKPGEYMMYWPMHQTEDIAAVLMPKDPCIQDYTPIQFEKIKFASEAECRAAGFTEKYCREAPKGIYFSESTMASISSPSVDIVDAEKTRIALDSQRRAECSDPKALDDPTCFGPSSTTCHPTDLSKRYEWCTTTIQHLCKLNDYKHDSCSCIAPFSDLQVHALAEFGVPAARYCVSVENSDDLHDKCKSGGYQITPVTRCPTSCINANLATDNGWAADKNVLVLCGSSDASIVVTVPGTKQPMSEWSSWWSAKKWQPFASGSASIDLMTIVKQFLRAVANCESAVDLYAIRPVVEGEIAGDEARIALEGIDARIAGMMMPAAGANAAVWIEWLNNNSGIFNDTTNPSITNVVKAASRVVPIATKEEVEQFRSIANQLESIPARAILNTAIAGLPANVPISTISGPVPGVQFVTMDRLFTGALIVFIVIIVLFIAMIS